MIFQYLIWESICLIRRGNTIGSMTSARIRAKTNPYSSRKISFSRSLDGPATFLGYGIGGDPALQRNSSAMLGRRWRHNTKH